LSRVIKNGAGLSCENLAPLCSRFFRFSEIDADLDSADVGGTIPQREVARPDEDLFRRLPLQLGTPLEATGIAILLEVGCREASLEIPADGMHQRRLVDEDDRSLILRKRQIPVKTAGELAVANCLFSSDGWSQEDVARLGPDIDVPAQETKRFLPFID